MVRENQRNPLARLDNEYQIGWLVGWVLWHMNLCRLFNAKYIFIKIISSVLNNSV